MKALILTILLGLTSIWAMGQTYSGMVVDGQSKEAIAYANIGVLNKNLGVISRPDGRFSIDLSLADPSDSLAFSMIGYAPFYVVVGNLNFEKGEVALQPTSYELSTIEVSDKERAKFEKFGVTKPSKTTTGHSGTDEFGFGGEWGLKIGNQGQRYWLQDVQFHLRFNTVDSVLFRVNIYSAEANVPGPSILHEPIFVTARKKEKWIAADVAEQHLIIDSDLIVTYEVIRIWYSEDGENHLYFTHAEKAPKGMTFSKGSSFDSWKLNEKPPVAIFVNGRLLGD
ncbi:carboxypeptidase-like regulatory domain-containing protein [Cryomorphaceae bacterium]|nr:carboxypeptidase-like regulatory domain-containing protein [Cryomorphaceae bacterium]